ncbi:hypothetical protein V5799_000358 [Amblyomma americanum]|uniref:Uncharacterized protein n=1 Tax=Amblyomma americanum TaxID=6943 RepID=A0AAQ4D3A1_AMBAM
MASSKEGGCLSRLVASAVFRNVYNAPKSPEKFALWKSAMDSLGIGSSDDSCKARRTSARALTAFSTSSSVIPEMTGRLAASFWISSKIVAARDGSESAL